MKRFWKGTDRRLDVHLMDSKGEDIHLSSILSMTIYFFTTGDEYVEFNYPQDILEDEFGIYIQVNENALSNLPDGLLKWEAHFKVKDKWWDNGRDTVNSCQTDIFIKTPGDFIPKSNTQEKEITLTENGSYEILPDAGYEGISRMNVINNTHPKLKSSDLGITFSNATFTEMPNILDISILTFNEVRQALGFPKVEDGDSRVMQMSYTTYDNIKDGTYLGSKTDNKLKDDNKEETPKE